MSEPTVRDALTRIGFTFSADHPGNDAAMPDALVPPIESMSAEYDAPNKRLRLVMAAGGKSWSVSNTLAEWAKMGDDALKRILDDCRKKHGRWKAA